MTLLAAGVSLALSLTALAAFIALFARRWQWVGAQAVPSAFRRWIFVDCLLVIAGCAMVAMSLHEIGHAVGNVDFTVAMSYIAIFFRGMLMAGAMALLLTFPREVGNPPIP